MSAQRSPTYRTIGETIGVVMRMRINDVAAYNPMILGLIPFWASKRFVRVGNIKLGMLPKKYDPKISQISKCFFVRC